MNIISHIFIEFLFKKVLRKVYLNIRGGNLYIAWIIAILGNDQKSFKAKTSQQVNK